MIIYPLLEAEACPPLTWTAYAVGLQWHSYSVEE